MAVRVSITVPKPTRYYSVEMFGGAATALAGWELVNYATSQLVPYMPAGNIATVALIASKSLIGYLSFEGARRTGGLTSDILYGVSYGTAISIVKDVVDIVRSKIVPQLTARFAAAPRVAPSVVVSPAPAPQAAVGTAETPVF